MTRWTSNAAAFRHLVFSAALGAVVFGASSLLVRAQNLDQLTQLLTTKSCPSCDLHNATIVDKDLSHANLKGANLSGANLYKTRLRYSSLKGANFSGANLQGTDLTGAVGAALTGATTDASTKCPNGNAGPCAG